jgi:hypothetical protein
MDNVLVKYRPPYAGDFPGKLRLLGISLRNGDGHIEWSERGEPAVGG